MTLVPHQSTTTELTEIVPEAARQSRSNVTSRPSKRSPPRELVLARFPTARPCVTEIPPSVKEASSCLLNCFAYFLCSVTPQVPCVCLHCWTTRQRDHMGGRHVHGSQRSASIRRRWDEADYYPVRCMSLRSALPRCLNVSLVRDDPCPASAKPSAKALLEKRGTHQQSPI